MPSAAPTDRLTEFVVLTGMSGAGRSTVANVLEDEGWFVTDNLPPELLTDLADLLLTQAADRSEPTRAAAVVDVRAREFFRHLEDALVRLRGGGITVRLVFLDANDESLVRRFESVRRPHPLQGRGRLLDGIHAERSLLAQVRANAEVVDTSGLNVHELTRKVRPMFAEGAAGSAVRVAVVSFGFKYGLPLDADHVFDMRFLPNPYWVPELRSHDGRDQPVADYVLSQPGAVTFVDQAAALLGTAIEGYHREQRRYVTVAVGCTGGKHRSVATALRLAEVLDAASSRGVDCFVVHRDLGRE